MSGQVSLPIISLPICDHRTWSVWIEGTSVWRRIFSRIEGWMSITEGLEWEAWNWDTQGQRDGRERSSYKKPWKHVAIEQIVIKDLLCIRHWLSEIPLGTSWVQSNAVEILNCKVYSSGYVSWLQELPVLGKRVFSILFYGNFCNYKGIDRAWQAFRRGIDHF